MNTYEQMKALFAEAVKSGFDAAKSAAETAALRRRLLTASVAIGQAVPNVGGRVQKLAPDADHELPGYALEAYRHEPTTNDAPPVVRSAEIVRVLRKGSLYCIDSRLLPQPENVKDMDGVERALRSVLALAGPVLVQMASDAGDADVEFGIQREAYRLWPGKSSPVASA